MLNPLLHFGQSERGEVQVVRAREHAARGIAQFGFQLAQERAGGEYTDR